MKRTKRKLLSLLLAAALCSGLAVPASAAGGCRVQNAANGLQSILRSAESPNDLFSLLLRLAQKNTAPCPNKKPAETPTETPEESPIEKPVETPVQKPAETVPSGGDVLPLEAAVAELVNRERAANGLGPLTLSAELCRKARIKSQDMAKNRYFSHDSPTYGSPFDMMRTLGVTYRSAGENIAMGYASAEAVMDGWMHSEGHRANILNASFTTIGIGYVANGNYWTQWFVG